MKSMKRIPFQTLHCAFRGPTSFFRLDMKTPTIQKHINQKNSLFACDYFFASSSSNSRIRKIISSSSCTGQKLGKLHRLLSHGDSLMAGLEQEDVHLNVCYYEGALLPLIPLKNGFFVGLKKRCLKKFICYMDVFSVCVALSSVRFLKMHVLGLCSSLHAFAKRFSAVFSFSV